MIRIHNHKYGRGAMITPLQFNCIEVAIDHLVEELEDVVNTGGLKHAEAELEATKAVKIILASLSPGKQVFTFGRKSDA